MPRHAPPARTANDRLKDGWPGRLGRSILLAVALHAALLLLWPRVPVRGVSTAPGGPHSLVSLRAAPRVTAPPAPGAVARPALPTVADLGPSVLTDFDAPLPVFRDEGVVEALPAPVLSLETDWLEYEHFAPFLVRPEIRNRNDMHRFLRRHYQPILDFSGAQGVVQVAFWIDERGAVQRAELAASSGSRALDRLAMRLSGILRFSPAMWAGRPVRVQVRLPIEFRRG